MFIIRTEIFLYDGSNCHKMLIVITSIGCEVSVEEKYGCSALLISISFH